MNDAFCIKRSVKMVNNLTFVINNLFQIYFWIILVRCLLSFVQTLDWSKQPFAVLRDLTDVYLDSFRRLIPPVSGIDFSPIIAIIVLQLLNYLLLYLISFFA